MAILHFNDVQLLIVHSAIWSLISHSRWEKVWQTQIKPPGVLCRRTWTAGHENRSVSSKNVEHPWVEHLTTLTKSGWAFFSVFPHLTMKERPCHVYSDLMHSNENADVWKLKYGNGIQKCKCLIDSWLRPCGPRVTLSLQCENWICGSRTAVRIAITMHMTASEYGQIQTASGPTNDAGSMLRKFSWQWCRRNC